MQVNGRAAMSGSKDGLTQPSESHTWTPENCRCRSRRAESGILLGEPGLEQI